MTRAIRILFYLFIVRPFLYLIIGIRIKGREHLKTEGQVLIISNHNSHLDTVVIFDMIGVWRMHRYRPVAAADYFESSWLVHFVTLLLFNILPIRRVKGSEKGGDPMATMAEALDRGESLILFPEGTRGEPEKMARFRIGAGRLIEKYPHIKVIPLHQHGLGRIMPRGEWLPVPVIGLVNVGAPRRFHGSAEEITTKLEDVITQLGREIRGEVEPDEDGGRTALEPESE